MATPIISIPQFSGIFAPASVPNAALVNASVTVTAGTGLSGGGAVALGASVTLSLPSIGPGAGTIGTAGISSITLDAQGRVTAATAATFLTSAFYQTIQAAGVDQTQRAKLNFLSVFSVTDDGANSRSTVTIAAAGVTNAMLANNSLTVTAGTGLSGGGSVALGASVTLSLPNVGPGATTTGGVGNWITGITTDAQGRITALTSTAQTANLLTGSLTSGVTPVASGANTLTNSSFTMAGAVFDLAAGATLFIGSSVATAVSVGSTNIVTYLGGTGPSTGSGSVRIFNPLYNIGSAATSGTTLVNSPFHYFQSNYWNGTASTALYGGIQMVPTSNTPHGYLRFGIGPTSPTEVVRMDDLGNVLNLPGGSFDVMAAGAANYGTTNATSISIGSSTSVTTKLIGTTPSMVTTAGINGAYPQTNTTNTYTGGSPIFGVLNNGTLSVYVTATGSILSLNGTVDTIGSGVQLNLGTALAGNIRIGAPANQTTIATLTNVIGDATTTSRSLIGGFQAAAGSGITPGAWTLRGANGAASDGTTTAGAAGQIITVLAGTGGSGSGTFAPGGGAVLNLLGGNAGASGTGNANGGNVVIDGGIAQGTGSGGQIQLGTSSATSAVVIGRTAITTVLSSLAINLGDSSTSSFVFARSQANADAAAGSVLLTGGTGGNAVSVGGGAGGANIFRGGTGGTGTGALAPGAGGVSSFLGGNAGTGGTGNAAGGNAVIDGGAGSGTGAGGLVLLGNNTNTSSVTIGHTGMPSGITLVTGSGGLTITGPVSQGTGSFSFTGTSQSQLTTTSGSLVLDSASGGLVDIGVTTTGGIAIGRSAITTTINGTVSIPNSVSMATGSFTYTGTMTGSSTAFSYRSTAADTVGDKLMSWGGTSEKVYLGQTFSGGYELRSTGVNIGLRNSNGDGVVAQGAGATYIYGANNSQVLFSANTSITDVSGFGLAFGTQAAPWATIGATLINTYNNNVTARASAFTSNNSAVSTVSQNQWAAGNEYVSHGWGYLPGVVTNIGGLVRASNVTTATTTTAHGFASGINVFVYVGDNALFPPGLKGPITVTGANTFTYPDVGTNGSSIQPLNIWDATGQDQTVKLTSIMRPSTAQAAYPITGNSGAAYGTGPELVYFRSSYPNNGAYAEWFKFSPTTPYSINGEFGSTGGVTMRTRTLGGADGSYVMIAPGQVALTDDGGFGIITSAQAGQPMPGAVSVSGMLLSLGGSGGTAGQLGASVGAPTAPWFDVFGVRGDFQNIGIGDIATTRWNDQTTGLTSWFNSNGSSFGPYGMLTVGGQTRHQAMGSAAGAAIANVGTAGSTAYAYAVVAADRNGYTSLPVFVGTATGNATLGVTNYNNITWTAPVNGGPNCRYDIYRGITSTGVSLIRATSKVVTVTGLTAHGLTVGSSFYVVGGTNVASFATGVFQVVSVPSTSSVTYWDASDITHAGTLTTGIVSTLNMTQSMFVASTTGLFFHDTGAARYTSTNNIIQPAIVSTVPTGGSGSSIQYGVYALDADNHVIASTLGTAGSGGFPSPVNPWTITWTPVGGSVAYLLTRGDMSHPIALWSAVVSQTAGGNVAVAGMVRSGAGAGNITVTVVGGHGFKVGDTATLTTTGTDITNFSSATITVVAVTSATVFTYTYTATGGNATSANTATLTNGPPVVTSSFTDRGFPTRALGPVTRNNTADVLMDGQLTINAQATGMSLQMTGSATNFNAMAAFRDAAGTLHFGIDDAGLPSLGNYFDFRETWLWANSLSAITTTPVTNSSTIWNFAGGASATYGGFSGWSGTSVGTGIALNLPATSAISAYLSTNAFILRPDRQSNLYAVVEWTCSLSTGGTAGTFCMGLANSNMATATHPGGYYFLKSAAVSTWQCVTDDAVAQTMIDSGVAVGSGVPNAFRIEFYGSGTALGVATVKFYIDNALVGTSQTNVYAGAGVKLAFSGNTTSPTAQVVQIGPARVLYNQVANPLAT